MAARRRPAKKYIKGKVLWIRRFLGRVKHLKEGCICMDLWPTFSASLVREFHECIDKKTDNLTVVGKIFVGAPVEMWSWREDRGGGETYVRLHIKRLALK